MFTKRNLVLLVGLMLLLGISRAAPVQAQKGPICAALPLTFHENVFPNPNDPTPYDTIDVFESDAPGNLGWLFWNPDPSQTQGNKTLIQQLNNQLMVNTHFTDANDASDHHLSVTDDVAAATGVSNSSKVRELLLRDYVGKTVIVPVHSGVGGNGRNTYYMISHFARVTINTICLPAHHEDTGCGKKGEKRIEAIFRGYADDVCAEP